MNSCKDCGKLTGLKLCPECLQNRNKMAADAGEAPTKFCMKCGEPFFAESDWMRICLECWKKQQSSIQPQALIELEPNRVLFIIIRKSFNIKEQLKDHDYHYYPERKAWGKLIESNHSKELGVLEEVGCHVGVLDPREEKVIYDRQQMRGILLEHLI